MFGMNPSDDPVKAAWMSAGMQMLAGGDPNQALAQLPQMIMQAKKMKAEQDLDKRRLAISESQLEMDREKLKIYRDENARADALQKDKTKLGEGFAKYNLQPNMGGMLLPQPQGPMQPKLAENAPTDWSADDMVTRQMKGDAAMPMGEEGNPITKRIMQLPLSIRQGLAEAPISAGEIGTPAISNAMEAAFGKTGGDRAPQIKTFTDGQKTITLDLNDPEDYQTFQGLDQSKITEVPNKTLEKAAEDPNAYLMEPYKKQITAAQEDAATAMDQADEFSNLGSLLLRPDVYTGAGAKLVNNLLSSAQDVFGAFPEVDFSTVEGAEKSRRAIVLGLREGFQKDSQMSNSDREYFQGMVVGEENKPETIARAVAARQLASQYKSMKAEFLENAVTNEKMTPAQAIKEWNKQSKQIRNDVASEENVQAIMKTLLEGANDDTLVEYVTKLAPGGAKKVEQQLGVDGGEAVLDGKTPETAIPMRGPNDHKALAPGAYYTDPEGNVRQKQ